ncbi:hypothetical protein DPR02_22605 [Burkholderia cepacia]|uniref:Uncharacterized protein n=1 Tax=Burkholderia cepacia TaxID=292 RepID=A0AAQ0F9Y2_BURCE|nr:hypothetical protein DPR02_22605 [Burkholderia cepacia]
MLGLRVSRYPLLKQTLVFHKVFPVAHNETFALQLGLVTLTRVHKCGVQHCPEADVKQMRPAPRSQSAPTFAWKVIIDGPQRRACLPFSDIVFAVDKMQCGAD